MASFDKINYELGLWECTNNSMFWSVVLDKRNVANLYSLPQINNWSNYSILCEGSAINRYLHPELFFINDSVMNSILLPLVTAIYFSLENNIIGESYINPIFVLINLVLSFYAVLLLITFYFSYYNNSTKDENTLDQDFMTFALTVEAEEEIASIDDISLSFFLLIFIFGWFFYTNSILILTNIPETSTMFYCFPFLYFMIVMIPVMLLYDYGIFYATYLRGAATTASFVMELLYDYIAIGAFFLRLLVQNVRLILMSLVFFSLYECILGFIAFTSWFNNYEVIWENNIENNYSTSNASYYFLFKLPGQLIYWIYELLHTFFIVTAQFAAFFAMIFWLFLFLFTMFVSEQQERYIDEKRKLYKKNLIKN